ncbi:MAG: transglutaminase domain-containing protein [Myxococcaceae bacterium]|nr:transglutaminase domain-containing protein [Myxococcaceae bacterium]
MSEPTASPSRISRAVEMLPVFAALLLHALAHGRWLLCVPAAGLMAAMVLLDKRPGYSSRRLLISAVVVGAGGATLSGLWPMPAPIPPIVMGSICGALVGLSTFAAICGRQTYAIIYALLLVSLSAAVRGSTAVYVGLAAVAASLLGVAFARGRLGAAGLVGGLGFGAFVLVMLGASFGLWRFVRASEGVLTDTLLDLMQNAPPVSGMTLQSEITLERQGRMPDAGKLLMELRGARPERLRTVVFDTFDGERWTTSRELRQTLLALTPPSPGEALRETKLTLLEHLRPYLPAPAGTREIKGVATHVLGGWMLRADTRQGSTLTLHHEGREQLPAEPPPAASLTALPEALRAELRPLALELTRGATTPRERAAALERWFREHHEYSLTVDLSGEGSPLAVLIRERRPAWCTYFASAMAALLRSLDVPARLAGGFVPPEERSASGAAQVRERDAHAWVEVYLEEEGRFVPFDPTPWRSREALLGKEQPGGLGAIWGAFTSALSAPPTWLVVAALVGWRLVARYRRKRTLRPREAMRGADPGLTAAYARYLRAMKRGAGLVPSPTETDEELLLRLRAARGARAVALAEEFITHYRRARYGGGAADPASLGALTSELERTLRQER